MRRRQPPNPKAAPGRGLRNDESMKAMITPMATLQQRANVTRLSKRILAIASFFLAPFTSSALSQDFSCHFVTEVLQKAWLSQERLINLIREKGTDCELTATEERTLRGAGAGDQLLEAIRRNNYRIEVKRLKLELASDRQKVKDMIQLLVNNQEEKKKLEDKLKLAQSSQREGSTNQQDIASRETDLMRTLNQRLDEVKNKIEELGRLKGLVAGREIEAPEEMQELRVSLPSLTEEGYRLWQESLRKKMEEAAKNAEAESRDNLSLISSGQELLKAGLYEQALETLEKAIPTN